MQRMVLAVAISVTISICPAVRADDPPAPASSVQTVQPEDAEAILGCNVTGPDGKDIGRLVDVLVDENGQPQAAVIDFGGFMGVGSRKVAVHWSALRFKPSGKHQVTLEMTPDQIKAAPEFSNTGKAAPVVTPADAAPAPTPAH
nr:PRC-barrel domain-containing protein [uncultured Rhodopila sp.]